MTRRKQRGEYTIAPSFCLSCGHTFTHASNLTNNSKPNPGDFTMCISCGHLMRFTEGLGIEMVDEATAKAEMSAANWFRITRARLAIKLIGPAPKETKH